MVFSTGKPEFLHNVTAWRSGSDGHLRVYRAGSEHNYDAINSYHEEDELVAEFAVWSAVKLYEDN